MLADCLHGRAQILAALLQFFSAAQYFLMPWRLDPDLSAGLAVSNGIYVMSLYVQQVAANNDFKLDYIFIANGSLVLAPARLLGSALMMVAGAALRKVRRRE